MKRIVTEKDLKTLPQNKLNNKHPKPINYLDPLEEGCRAMAFLLETLKPDRNECLGLGEAFIEGVWAAVQAYRKGGM